MRGIASVLVTAVISGTVVLSSASVAIALEPNRRAEIVESVGKFVEAIGCSYEADNQQDLLIADLGATELEGTTYIAFPMVDVGCVVGSGTIYFMPVVLTASDFGSQTPYVDLWATANVDFVELPGRALEAVEALDANHIRIAGYSYREDDPSCCPTKRVDRVYKQHWGRGEGLWVPEFD
ncbi:MULTISPECIES: hypothetical protein [unclassified Ruegeria]|uniref:hypothetical protein n=1 Tax=unclassified Ruegeria TaxID=2625375 RepID=UPI001AE696DA|nr:MULTISPECIES: hypothetical protein [unclassified Ruegeria]